MNIVPDARKRPQFTVIEASATRLADATESFGLSLRRERERRGISLDAVAARTKVQASLFAALERNDVSKWPSGIFRRSFVRGYAQAVGLDPEETLSQFLQAFPEPQMGTDGGARERSAPTPPVASGTASPLRLTLAEEPPALFARAVPHGNGQWLAVGLELAVAVSVSGVAGLVGGWPTFWVALGCATVLIHAAGALGPDSIPFVWLLSHIPGTQGRERARRVVSMRRSHEVDHLTVRAHRKTSRRRSRLGA